jgi:ABC-type transporter Mla MlaB component
LLIEWLRIGKQSGKEVHFANVPAQIEALARISEVDDLIGTPSEAGRSEPARKSKK